MKRNIRQIYLLPLAVISPKEIEELKKKHNLFDWEIAQLFNVKQDDISAFRYKHGIKTIAPNDGEHENITNAGQGKYNEFEIIAAQLYSEYGFNFKKMHPFAKYDFLVNGLKIDVKGANIQKNPHHPFRLATKRHYKKTPMKERCDFVHGICMDKKQVHHYFIPAREINCTMISLRPFGKSKWNRFLNALPFGDNSPLDKPSDVCHNCVRMLGKEK